MSKIKCFFLFLLGLSASATVMNAQDVDFEKEFDDFQRQQLKEFDDFKNKADAEFDTFLRATWAKFEAFEPVTPPVRPEPVKQPVFDGKKAESPIEIKPAPVKVPEQSYLPVKIDAPVVPITEHPVHRTSIDFYGSSLEVATDAIEDLALAGNREADVADAWSKLCKASHEQLIKDCMTLREERKMSDWAYLLFIKKIGEQLYGEQQKDDIAFLQMFILNKSGYKVRLSKINEKLKLMVAPAGALYGMPYIVLEGTKYYVFDAEKTNGPMGVYTYKQDFPDAKNYISLSIDAVPKFDMDEYTESVSPKSGSVQVETIVNKNLMEFYKNYPQCDVSVYYHAPMSEELKTALYPPLKEAIKGKSQQEAANLLIEFVQTGFEYQTDGEQFGYEKPFFLDENFFYSACDCEDRAILYSTLVKDLLGLDAILLDYPNHIASAVRFTEEIPGDYVVLDDGTKYLICDPTYIGASIGMCMEQFKNVSPQIIR
ncbi:hypothetical protein [Bacteroides sp.]